MARFQLDRPLSISLQPLVSLPARYRDINASLIVPVQQPRSFKSDSASILATAKGTPPTPRERTAPSGISLTTSLAIFMSTSLAAL